ncbi:chain-length determining protein [Arthrobacter agilis]|uniref:chain-length determining protein n=1 Tax=Arthrobacter agilis TaxID=37921 RepID=UPI00236504FD|nr:chain-length determining protein [Arthrobacter agilis]WDF34218.1 chain-length determining protein [Arthrobacter agilis]
MDPLAVVRTLWRFKAIVLPVVLLTAAAIVFVYQFGPRSYESSVSYALVNPQMPTSNELESSPELRRLNDDNPYLRSADPSLVTNVLVTRLRAAPVSNALEDAGLGEEYTVTPGVGGFIVNITGTGTSPQQSLDTTTTLGAMLEDELLSIQTINGADSRYLFTSLLVAPPEEATEHFSSRLRAVIVVALGGAVLLFGGVSVGRGFESARAGNRVRKATGGLYPASADEGATGGASELKAVDRH